MPTRQQAFSNYVIPCHSIKKNSRSDPGAHRTFSVVLANGIHTWDGTSNQSWTMNQCDEGREKQPWTVVTLLGGRSSGLGLDGVVVNQKQGVRPLQSCLYSLSVP